jgi:hypothetical protein
VHSGELDPTPVSPAGLTRGSIHLRKMMDCRVKPGNDRGVWVNFPGKALGLLYCDNVGGVRSAFSGRNERLNTSAAVGTRGSS